MKKRSHALFAVAFCIYIALLIGTPIVVMEGDAMHRSIVYIASPLVFVLATINFLRTRSKLARAAYGMVGVFVAAMVSLNTWFDFFHAAPPPG
jgi:hypothetical protein